MQLFLMQALLCFLLSNHSVAATVAWDAPPEEINTYRIYIDDGINQERHIEVPGTQTSVNTSVLGCLPRISYTLTATALNAVGESPRSNQVVWRWGDGDVFLKMTSSGGRFMSERNAAGVLVK